MRPVEKMLEQMSYQINAKSKTKELTFVSPSKLLLIHLNVSCFLIRIFLLAKIYLQHASDVLCTVT